MAEPCVPSLTTVGWATEPAQKFDFAFADFMLSNYSQSREYSGSIASLPYVIQQTTGDPSALESLAKRTLSAHLSGLFDDITVETSVRENPNDPSKLQLLFYITTLINGVAYNFARGIQDIDSKTLRLFDINNG